MNVWLDATAGTVLPPPLGAKRSPTSEYKSLHTCEFCNSIGASGPVRPTVREDPDCYSTLIQLQAQTEPSILAHAQ